MRTVAAGVVVALAVLAACGDSGNGEQVAQGKTVFTSAGCGSCHTLGDAGATGVVGPNLDDVQPGQEVVASFVTNGSPPRMPSFAGRLSDDEIEAVAAYVSDVTGGAEGD